MKRVRLRDGTRVWAAGRLEARFLHDEIFQRETYGGCEEGAGPGSVVLDAGANIGLFSLWIARRAAGARLYCFEPVPETYRILERNAREHLPGARLFPCGLASFDGEAPFTVYDGAAGWSTRFPREGEYREALFRVLNDGALGGTPGASRLLGHLAPRLQRSLFDRALDRIQDTRRELWLPVRRLESLVEAEGLERIDLLKIDVEGGELDLLEGLGERSWSLVRRLVLEILDVEGAKEKVLSLLRDRAFRVTESQDSAYLGTRFSLIHATRS